MSNCLDGISSGEEERESAAPQQQGRGPGLRACAAALVETGLAYYSDSQLHLFRVT